MRSFYSVVVGTYLLSFLGHKLINGAQTGWERLKNRVGLPKAMKIPRQAFVAMYVSQHDLDLALEFSACGACRLASFLGEISGL